MDRARSNIFEVETALLHVATLDEETYTNLVKLSCPKLSQTKKAQYQLA